MKLKTKGFCHFFRHPIKVNGIVWGLNLFSLYLECAMRTHNPKNTSRAQTVTNTFIDCRKK